MKIANYNYYGKGEQTLAKLIADFYKYHNVNPKPLVNEIKTIK